MYSFEGRVRYSEVDTKKQLPLNMILDYFQDCSCFHSESIHAGITDLEDEGFAWLLASWQIIVNRYPVYPEKIKVTTLPYGFKGFLGLRNFKMEDEQGNVIAYANSIWVFTNMKTAHPSRIPKDISDRYTFDEKLEMDYAPRKIDVPAQGEKRESVCIHASQLDSNLHVNNGQYVALAQEYLPKDFEIHQMRADYRNAAVLGDIVIPIVTDEGEKVTVQLCDEKEEPYAIVEFLRK